MNLPFGMISASTGSAVGIGKRNAPKGTPLVIDGSPGQPHACWATFGQTVLDWVPCHATQEARGCASVACGSQCTLSQYASFFFTCSLLCCARVSTCKALAW